MSSESLTIKSSDIQPTPVAVWTSTVTGQLGHACTVDSAVVDATRAKWQAAQVQEVFTLVHNALP